MSTNTPNYSALQAAASAMNIATSSLNGVVSNVNSSMEEFAQTMSSYVNIGGTQTVTGAKTFTARNTFNDRTTFAGSSGGVVIIDQNSGNGLIYGTSASSGGYANTLRIWGAASIQNGASLQLHGISDPTSGYAGAFDLAPAVASSSPIRLIGDTSGNLTWNGNAIQTTSDERLKTELTTITDTILDAWGDVQWGQFQYLAACEEKGEDNARLHTGVVAQRIISAFRKHGLDACAYGLLCYVSRPAREWDEEIEGAIVHQYEPAVDLWTVRYAEALAMEAAYQRREVARLKARVAALEAKEEK